MLLGKRVRMERISDRNTRKTVIVPLSHGVGMGPIEGIEDIQNAIDMVSLAGANAIVLNKGVVPRAHRGKGRDIGLVVHLTGGSEASAKVQVCAVEEALRMGADGVRARLHVGGKEENRTLEILGNITRVAMDWGMPVLVTVSPINNNGNSNVELISRGARIAAELGADMVSVPYPGSKELLRDIVASTPAPLIVLGGEKMEDPTDVLSMVNDAMSTGIHGVSVGRNVFQYEKPGNMVKAIGEIVHHGASVAQAYKVLEEERLTSSVFSPPIW